MKKTTKTIVAVLAAATMALSVAGFAGCSGHSHTFSDKWTSDSLYHWHAATCTEEDECKTAISGKAAHVDANNDGKCDVCQATTKVVMNGSGETVGVDGVSMVPTVATFNVDFVKKEATIEVAMSIDFGNGDVMTFYILAEATSTDPAEIMQYSKCTPIGKGAVTEEAKGFKATFSFNYSETDEETGETTTTPMTLDVPFNVSNGVYTATITYGTVSVAVSSASNS